MKELDRSSVRNTTGESRDHRIGGRPRLLLSPPHYGERETAYIDEVVERASRAASAPPLPLFEERFGDQLGFGHCAALSSGTAAVHLGLRVLGIGEGECVFASTLTFIGGVSPVWFQGAELVLIDSDKATWNMDPERVAEEIERRRQSGLRLPKVVIPTDLYGQPADLDAINSVCRPLGISVISDSAEALGATFKGHSVGAAARAAVFSFNGNKIMTATGGGMLASDDAEFIEKARYYANQAREPAIHFEHREIGYNYRMSDICAAMGLSQLEVLDDRVRRKREIFRRYAGLLGELPGLSFMPEASYGESNRWLTVVLIDPKEFGASREAIRIALEEEDIESRPVWKPMHLQPCFQRLGVRVVGGKVAESLWEHGLCLPSGTRMNDSDIDRVSEVVRRVHAKG